MNNLFFNKKKKQTNYWSSWSFIDTKMNCDIHISHLYHSIRTLCSVRCKHWTIEEIAKPLTMAVFVILLMYFQSKYMLYLIWFRMVLNTISIVASSSFLILTEFLILFGNILVVLAVFKNKAMQTVTNFLIVNLSITDLLVAIFNCPLMFLAILAKGWIIGDVMCIVSGFLNVAFCCASILTLTAISIDR